MTTLVFQIVMIVLIKEREYMPTWEAGAQKSPNKLASRLVDYEVETHSASGGLDIECPDCERDNGNPVLECKPLAKDISAFS